MRTCVSWRGIAADEAPKIMSRCQLTAFASRSESIPAEILAPIPGVTPSVRKSPSVNVPSLSVDGFLHRRVPMSVGVRVLAPARPQRSPARACKRERENPHQHGPAWIMGAVRSQGPDARHSSPPAAANLNKQARRSVTMCASVRLRRLRAAAFASLGEQQDMADIYLHHGPRARLA